LFNSAGGMDLTLFEVNEAADVISRAAHPEANIIFGAVQDPGFDGKVKITVIATGFDGQQARPHMSVAQPQQKSMAYDRSMLYPVSSSSIGGNSHMPPRQPYQAQSNAQQSYGSLPVTPPPMNVMNHPTDPVDPAVRQRSVTPPPMPDLMRQRSVAPPPIPEPARQALASDVRNV